MMVRILAALRLTSLSTGINHVLQDLPAGLATSRLLASQLYGVAASDLWTLSSVAVLLSVVAMGAAFKPAWLASRIDPMALLRHE